jgi:fibrillarin-like pre-rRNA processing protein
MDAGTKQIMEEFFPGVYRLEQFLATKNLTPGLKVYNERLVKKDGAEYRTWDAFRSKLAGAIKKGLKTFPFGKGTKVLYLGASTGTTPSHVSDIIGPEGEIYAVEVSPHSMKLLMKNCEARENFIPIMADANKPDEYSDVGTVDVVYQDVAQPNQDEILIKNCDRFLKKGGIAMIAVKSQSIDVTKPPQEVFGVFLKRMEGHFEVLEKLKLEPYDKDHLFVVLKKK